MKISDETLAAHRAYEKAWKTFIESPLWDVKLSDRTPKQQADIEALADAAHKTYLVYSAMLSKEGGASHGEGR